MIIFEITFGMVLVFFLSIIVLGYSLFSSLSAIIFVGGSVGVIGLGIYMAGKQMIYAFREKKFVWLLYGLLSLFSGIFLPYIFYACIGCLCKPIDIASIAGPLIALIIMTILNAIETGMMEDDGGTIYHFIGIVCIMLALVSFTSLGVYQKWSEKKLALGINKNVKYTVDETCFPLVEERVMYASENSGETVRLPYWIGNVRYPFAMFKAGEEVYEIKAEYPEEYEWVGMKKNGDRRYEDCVLVCSSEKKL